MNDLEAQYGETIIPVTKKTETNISKVIRKNKRVTEIKLNNQSVQIPNIDYIKELEYEIIRLSNMLEQVKIENNDLKRNDNSMTKRIADIENYIRKGF